MEATAGGRNGATLLEVVPEFSFSLRALVAKGGVSRQFRSVAPFASLTCATAFHRGSSAAYRGPQKRPHLAAVKSHMALVFSSLVLFLPRLVDFW